VHRVLLTRAELLSTLSRKSTFWFCFYSDNFLYFLCLGCFILFVHRIDSSASSDSSSSDTTQTLSVYSLFTTTTAASASNSEDSNLIAVAASPSVFSASSWWGITLLAIGGAVVLVLVGIAGWFIRKKFVQRNDSAASPSATPTMA
jgi:hypothetical protein